MNLRVIHLISIILLEINAPRVDVNNFFGRELADSSGVLIDGRFC